jgi:hypothetical protein
MACPLRATNKDLPTLSLDFMIMQEVEVNCLGQPQ